MRKATLWLVVGAVALVGCRARVAYHGAGGGPRYAAQPLQPGWADVRQPGAGFACQMPTQPQIENRSGHDSDGAAYQSVRARAVLPYGTFAMIVTQWEGGVVGDPLTLARDLADTVVEGIETPDRHAERVTVPGFYAREDTGHVPDGSFFALRQFFGRDRVYVAVASVRNDSVGLAAAEHFMQSIALDRRDAMLPYGDSTEPEPLYLPDVDFAVNMPPLASRRTREIELGDATTDAWVFESRHPHGLYRITVVPLPERAGETPLDDVAQALSLGAAGRHVQASGFPGRVYAADADRRVRAFLTARRVYVLEVMGADALGDGVDDFFGSFRIL